MEACPPQVVLAHSQLARIIANVFVVGYEIFKEQMKGKNYPSISNHKKWQKLNPLYKNFLIFFSAFAIVLLTVASETPSI